MDQNSEAPKTKQLVAESATISAHNSTLGQRRPASSANVSFHTSTPRRIRRAKEKDEGRENFKSGSTTAIGEERARNGATSDGATPHKGREITCISNACCCSGLASGSRGVPVSCVPSIPRSSSVPGIQRCAQFHVAPQQGGFNDIVSLCVKGTTRAVAGVAFTENPSEFNLCLAFRQASESHIKSIARAGSRFSDGFACAFALLVLVPFFSGRNYFGPGVRKVLRAQVVRMVWPMPILQHESSAF